MAKFQSFLMVSTVISVLPLAFRRAAVCFKEKVALYSMPPEVAVACCCLSVIAADNTSAMALHQRDEVCSLLLTVASTCLFIDAVVCRKLLLLLQLIGARGRVLLRGGDAVPNGVVLDGHDAGRKQLELLLDLEAVAAAGHFYALVEHRRIWLSLQ